MGRIADFFDPLWPALGAGCEAARDETDAELIRRLSRHDMSTRGALGGPDAELYEATPLYTDDPDADCEPARGDEGEG